MSYIDEWMAAYEQEYGRKPAEPVIEVIRHIDKVGATLEEQGRKDSQEGRESRTAESFVELAQYAFHNDLDEETAQAVGEIWRIEYMNGYAAGEENA